METLALFHLVLQEICFYRGFVFIENDNLPDAKNEVTGRLEQSPVTPVEPQSRCGFAAVIR